MNPILCDWARNVGRRLADDFRRRCAADAAVFLEAEIVRGGPLLVRLRASAEAGFKEWLGEMQGEVA